LYALLAFAIKTVSVEDSHVSAAGSLISLELFVNNLSGMPGKHFSPDEDITQFSTQARHHDFNDRPKADLVSQGLLRQLKLLCHGKFI